MERQNRSEDDGRFENVCTDQEFIEVLLESDSKLATSSVAELVGLSRRQAYSRLKKLEEEGRVESERIGNSLEWDVMTASRDELSEAVEYISANLSSSPPIGLDSTQGMVITIREPHSQAIINGEKTVEFRRSKLREANHPEIGFIYEPSPTKAIVGVFSVASIETRSVENLQRLGEQQPTSTKESIQQYFEGKTEGTAIFIDRAEPIQPPIPLNSGSDNEWAFTPPQNFYYVDPGEFMVSIKDQKRDNPPGDPQQLGFPSSTS